MSCTTNTGTIRCAESRIAGSSSIAHRAIAQASVDLPLPPVPTIGTSARGLAKVSRRSSGRGRSMMRAASRLPNLRGTST